MVAKRKITTKVEVLIVYFNLLFNNYRNWEKNCVMNQLLPFLHAFFINYDYCFPNNLKNMIIIFINNNIIGNISNNFFNIWQIFFIRY